jgi:hypothetical protein
VSRSPALPGDFLTPLDFAPAFAGDAPSIALRTYFRYAFIACLISRGIFLEIAGSNSPADFPSVFHPGFPGGLVAAAAFFAWPLAPFFFIDVVVGA